MMGSERTITLKDYENLGSLGFTTTFCAGCVYNSGDYDTQTDRLDAAKKCIECMPGIGRLYRSKQPIRIVKDKTGKNTAEPLNE